jgi:TP901 family phage tail tape measure protein
MKAFVIPSIFTAIDKFSAPLKNMSANVQAFASKAEVGVSKAERAFRKMTPGLSDVQKQLFQFATAAALAGVVIGGIKFGFDSLTKYEDAVASFRTIVSNLTDKEFSKFEDKIASVAKTTDASTIQVAQSFEKIAGLNASFAQTADGLGQVSQAAIILSRASKDDLGSSAENLVGIMNQFSLSADQANRTINVLAAGQSVGAANIKQTSEAFVNFGSVAAGANITLEQSVGLVQTLGKYSLFGAEAGTKLRGSVLKLQQAGMGYKSGQFQINDALAETKKKFDSLKTAKQQDAYLNKVFGAENISTGRILVSNIDLFNQFTKGVTGTSEAQRAAAINSATFTAMVEKLKNKFINWITTSEDAKKLLDFIGKGMKFVANNMSTIIKVVGYGVGIFASLWAIIKVVRIGLIAYNIVLGITSALSTTAAIAVGKSNIALKAYNVTTKLVTAAQWLWNAAMAANPIGLMIVGAVALGAAIYGVYQAVKGSNAVEKVRAQVMERALENTIDQRVEVTLLFSALRKASQGSAEYKGILEQINKIQPGIVDKYNLQAKAIKNINAAERELIASILERGKVEARAELLKEKTKDFLTKQTAAPSFMEKVNGGFNDNAISLLKTVELIGIQKEINALAADMVPTKEAINTKKSAQDGIINNIQSTQQNGTLDINIIDPGGNAKVTPKADFVKVNTSSTMQPSK